MQWVTQSLDIRIDRDRVGNHESGSEGATVKVLQGSVVGHILSPLLTT